MIENRKILIIITGAITILSVIAPYIHIFLDKTDQIKIFGFRNIRTFLYVLGLPISLFSCAVFLLYSTKFMNETSPKKYFKKISFLFLWSSFFQFIWIFWDKQDLPKVTYYIIILLISFFTTYYFKKAIGLRKETLIKLQNIVNSLSRFSIITVKKHIPKENQERYKKDLINALKEGNE
ncbi:hypothetical protein LNJ40_10555 [Tenacibaculum dicentrarchi]|uniref:hypothetical protein n=1 Tax=Tenacibaculum dicentrarchi TaxID=669041 RepID=UPI000C619256|nr:hypothetical protein [Tenacibaculum dicentrarchi]SOS48938.1 conserved membrane hypothetical protein [Tenacibaculum dicentrarchi]